MDNKKSLLIILFLTAAVAIQAVWAQEKTETEAVSAAEPAATVEPVVPVIEVLPTPLPEETPSPAGPHTVFEKNDTTQQISPPLVPIENGADEFCSGRKNGKVSFDPLKCPYFSVEGFSNPQSSGYYRLKPFEAASYSEGIQRCAGSTAGGRIRFRTDSEEMTIQISLKSETQLSRMARLGTSGIDIYYGSGSERQYLKSVYPRDNGRSYSETVKLTGEVEEYTIMLPLYSTLSALTISLDGDSQLGLPKPYTYEKPVVFYGSSITQGAAASRPGTSYTQMVTRMLDVGLVNLGLDASARGEQIIAKFIAGLDMSALVMEYDYNAPSAQWLQDTHYDFYKTVRQAQPEVPIIFMSRFNVDISEEDEAAQRRAVIRESYDRALAEGDENVYFIDGQYVFPEVGRDLCHVDGIHPNDLGMYYIAQSLYPVLKDALEQ